MTKTQDVKDGVLLRPFETLATNFLSSHYYNGRQIVDLLDTTRDAHRWTKVIHTELHGPTPFAPAQAELESLHAIRDNLESLYKHTVEYSPQTQELESINATLNMLRLRPQLALGRNGFTANWTDEPNDATGELIAAILISAVDTISEPRAGLLRRCHAPRCVLYFTQLDSRQHWCSNVCGNRARVARAAHNRQPR